MKIQHFMMAWDVVMVIFLVLALQNICGMMFAYIFFGMLVLTMFLSFIGVMTKTGRSWLYRHGMTPRSWFVRFLN